MYLSKIAVQNFRNLKNVEVSLGPGLNVIVGVNNVGKTSLLDAVRVALGPASTGPDSIWITEDDLYRDTDGVVHNKSFRVDLHFSGLTEDECGEFLDILNYDAESPDDSTASIHFEATWSDARQRFDRKKWGGERSEGEAQVPEDILQSIPVTLLGALRDAERGLRPGRDSRLGKLVRALSSDADEERMETIVRRANSLLERTPLVTNSQNEVCGALKNVAGEAFAPDAAIRTTDAKFNRISSALRLILHLGGRSPDTGVPATEELASNGLGYNNLLFIATVLAQLESTLETTLPLFLLEEPEAHLHPQMQIVLAKFLESKSESTGERVQSLVTTHSPTIASAVSPSSIRVLHHTPDSSLRCCHLVDDSLDEKEQRQIQRLLDITRATLLFSRGVIFVEGISEALLMPVFARRLQRPLEDRHISVVQVGGVGFRTLLKLFRESGLQIPFAIVSDADPDVTIPDDQASPKWTGATPGRNDEGVIQEGARLSKLRSDMSPSHEDRLFSSRVTLEYDLAEAESGNADVMCEVWESLLTRPQTFNSDLLAAAGDDNPARALAAWRGICVASPSIGKAEFAHSLADFLEAPMDAAAEESSDTQTPSFAVPDYLSDAICRVYDEAAP